MKRWPLFASFVLFAVLCVSVAHWAWQLVKPTVRPVAAQRQWVNADINRNTAGGLFGERAAAVAASNNFQLKGVVVAQNERDSMAILQIDGKPAQAVGVGAEVLPDVTVIEVHRQYVLLLEHGLSKRIELPENVKSQAIVSFNAPVRTPTLPVQSAGATTPQISPASPNMVLHMNAEKGGLPEIAYAQANVSSNAPIPSTGVPAQQIQSSPNMVVRMNAGKMSY